MLNVIANGRTTIDEPKKQFYEKSFAYNNFLFDNLVLL